jgi:hypothetical protein
MNRSLRVVLVAALISILPRAAHAAFELRDASPEALGAVSVDVASEPMFDAVGSRRAGIRFGASHSSLYQVEGLAQERVWAGIDGRRASVSLAYAKVGVPGVVESSARLALRESAAHAVALEVDAERLDLALDGEPRDGGWAFGGTVRARVSFPRFDLEISVAADRILQSAGLDRLAVAPSVPVTIRPAGGRGRGAVTPGGTGRRSPRLVLDVPVTGAARLRFGRGEAPGRIGAALAIHLSRIEVSAGRMDQSAGGWITGVAIGLVPAGGGR